MTRLDRVLSIVALMVGLAVLRWRHGAQSRTFANTTKPCCEMLPELRQHVVSKTLASHDHATLIRLAQAHILLYCCQTSIDGWLLPYCLGGVLAGRTGWSTPISLRKRSFSAKPASITDTEYLACDLVATALCAPCKGHCPSWRRSKRRNL